MTGPESQVSPDVAKLVAVIEGASADLAMAEEPAGFVVALESGGDDD